MMKESRSERDRFSYRYGVGAGTGDMAGRGKETVSPFPGF